MPPTFDPGFTTPGISAVFSASGRLARMAEAEVALAAAQAVAGQIPDEAAVAIADSAARVIDEVDAEAIAVAGWDVGTPVIPLLERWRSALHAEVAPWLHHRATTQDIVDTATMLQTREARRLIASRIAVAVDRLDHLISEVGDQPVLARTLMQPALMTTWSHRLAAWRRPLASAAAELAATALPAQLAGPIGDGAGLGEAVVAEFARLLDLDVPATPWQTDRSPIIDVLGCLAAVVRASAKIAGDLVLLAQPELGDVEMRAGGSSAMAHKRNPIDAIRCRAAALAFDGVASIVTRSSAHELERAAGSWQAEWFAVPVAFQTAGATVDALAQALGGCTITAPSPRHRRP